MLTKLQATLDTKEIKSHRIACLTNALELMNCRTGPGVSGLTQLMSGFFLKSILGLRKFTETLK